MKYFKLVNKQGWPFYDLGKIYREDYMPNGIKIGVFAEVFPLDWQQVPKPKKSLSEQIEKLKKQAEKEGMKCEVVLSSPTFSATNPKDEWEFAEATVTGTLIEKGKIYKVLNQAHNCIDIFGETNRIEERISKIFFKPSTEQAYIEQLKAKAMQLFGEIKEGDRFIDVERNIPLMVEHSISGFVYSKEIDALCIGGVLIYYKGKWAKRVKERVKVKNWSYRTEEKKGKIYHELVFTAPIKKFSDDVHIFITKQLEEYLNS